MGTVRSALTPRIILMMLLVVVLIPLSPLLITRRWDWWEAWVFGLVWILGFVAGRALAFRRQGPGLLAERAHFLDQKDAKPWDKLLAPVVGIGAGLIPIVAGVDVLSGWSPQYSLPVRLLGLALMLAGYALASWALIENRFFSGMVRIQEERGHRTVSTGPYALVRHPGYSGALLSYIGMPLFLSSRWAFVVVAILGAALLVRTGLEDKTLQAELPGYRQYAERVRCRLIPGVW